MFGVGKKPATVAEFRVPLGVKVRHVITGLEGIATARIQYLTGCNQIGIQPYGINKDTQEPYKSMYFDEPFVEVLSTDVIQPVVPRGKDDGCDTNPPPSR